MTQIELEPKPDVGGVRAAVLATIQETAIRRVTIAREANVNPSVLSQFLHAKYAGDNEGVAIRLGAWLNGRAICGTAAPAAGGREIFVLTEAAAKITAVLEYAQTYAKMAMVVGEPGVGKTEALKQARRQGGAVWLATMFSSSGGTVPALEELGAAVGLSFGSRDPSAILRDIVARVRNTGGLILVDEAQHLDSRALDAMRGVHDAAGVGMVLCGNMGLAGKVVQLPQVNSRIARRIQLKKPAAGDVAAICRYFDIAGFDEIEFLHTLAQHSSGLRAVVNTAQLATLAAKGEGMAASMLHLSLAWEELSMEGWA